jgi:hypothetical protein
VSAIVDRSDGVNYQVIRPLGTRYHAGLGETTNVASFYGSISDIHGSSDSRTHATGSSGHVVHRAQTRAPASHGIY